MKPLVYVSYFFPPTGGAGVQRSVKFVRYLPDHGYDPTVITVRRSHYWMQDDSLSDEIPETVRVVRTLALTGPGLLGGLGFKRASGEKNTRRSGRLQASLRRVSQWITIPDPYVGWVPFATSATSRNMKPGSLVLTTSSPDSAHLVGLNLARRGVPWIADFRDPWLRRMSFSPPTSLHRRLHETLELRVVRNASRIVVTSEATRLDFLTRYPFLKSSRVLCIPNGYDEDDFPKTEPERNDQFVLLHLGQLNPERPIDTLLDHLEAFFELRPDARDETVLNMVGPRYEEDELTVKSRGLEPYVRFESSLPHREAILRLLKANVLILMEQESERGGLILPGKTFEYLRAQRPILGLLPRGAAWDLLGELDAGCCALPSDSASGAPYLSACFDAFKKGTSPPGLPHLDKIARFERRELCGRLAALLDSVLEDAPRIAAD